MKKRWDFQPYTVQMYTKYYFTKYCKAKDKGTNAQWIVRQIDRTATGLHLQLYAYTLCGIWNANTN